MIITKEAAARIHAINLENQTHARLRIAVQSGGCAGFQYSFLMDDEALEEDKIFTQDGAEVIIDDVSLSLIGGSVLDFQDDLTASMFVIKNPNAVGGCGCGNSFSI